MLQSSTKRIVRNSLMLYLRMMLSMVVGFYTSRVVLQTLGVVDYGIYGLVGGIVSMMGFLNASLSSATSQCITFQVGTGDKIKLNQIFNTAFQAHLFIALILLVIADTVGLWFLNNHLVIPVNRFLAANIVFQFSVFSSLVSILQVPYTALILAHEQMEVFAGFEMLNVSLKLVIVWIIRVIPYDPIIPYAFLSFLLTLIILGLFRFYCRQHFSAARLSLQWHPELFNNLIRFFGWNTYADASTSFRQQGINILINRFFGVLVNASCSVASMVQGAVWLCGHNVLTAFRPQIVKQYAAGNIFRMEFMLSLALKYSILLSLLFTVPAVFCMPFLLSFWLGRVPQLAVPFCQILLLDNLFGLANHVITIGIYSQGKIKAFSLINGTIKLLCLPIIFLLLKVFLKPEIPYLFCLIVLFVVLFVNLFLLKRAIPEIHLFRIIGSIVQPLALGCLATIVVLPFFFFLDQDCIMFVSVTLTYGGLLAIGSYLWLVDAQSRSWLKTRITWFLK